MSWVVLDRKRVFCASPWFEVWQEKIRLPDGRVVPDYYKFAMPDSCIIIALTQDLNIVLLKNYRHGIGCEVLNMPAGFVEDTEAPIESAQRELLEETGYDSSQWISLGACIRDANRGAGQVHIFLALNVSLKIEEPVSGDLEVSEVLQIPFQDFCRRMLSCQTRTLGMTTALLLAKDYMENVRN